MNKYLTLLISIILVANPAYAEMDSKSVEEFKSIGILIINFSYLLGVVLVGTGVFGFRKHGLNPQQYTISYCVMHFFSGVLLLLLTYTYGVFKRSTIDESWQDSREALAIDKNVLQDLKTLKGTFITKFMPDHMGFMLLGFIYVFGLIAFVRGIYLLKNIGSQNSSQDGGFAKAAAFIGGGIVCMNITDFSCMISATIGVKQICLKGT